MRIIAYLLDLAASVIITAALYRFVGQALFRLFEGYLFLAQTFSNSMLFFGSLGYWVFVPLATGSTPGKMLFHMKVVPESRKPVGPAQVVLREVIGHAVNALTLGVGFLMASRDPRLRGLNDRLAGTRLIQFTSPRPELYRIQDLCTIDEEGTLQSESAVALEVFEAALEGAPESQAVTELDTAPGVESPAIDEGPAPEAEAQAAAQQQPTPEKEAVIGSLYTRPTGETAYERRLRAAKGPTIEELATALRRTAEMVADGQLMQKVLDRKREDFVQQVKTAELGEPPAESVGIIVELGKDGILTRSELEEVRDTLRKRLSR